ncbi:hypothetical protein DWG18_07305 [Lysobacter sp. TY2-98]|uniref:hypothetical protein n=1 Tax=Lysobacter sp. TY2-98 TaxID=2290922 RepID=UPI000E209D5D|nr:hypothetical protein [Lysobacter sp. TY2-98]AXK72107.1 hypothetical protein DWG18_07305 [Lysobacter sp. TY2-98]
MHPNRLLLPVLVAALTACATAQTTSDLTPTSNPMTGANARPNPSPLAVGAYSAIGTSDDVRGRSGAGGSSVLTGRANLAGDDAGTPAKSDTSTSATSDEDDSTSNGSKKKPTPP